MTDNHSYEVRGWRSGQHMSYSIKCPECGKRHMLRRGKAYRIGTSENDMYYLTTHEDVYAFYRHELDAMAAENG